MRKIAVIGMIVLFTMMLVYGRAAAEEPNIVAFGEDLIDISQFSQWNTYLYIDGGEETIEVEGATTTILIYKDIEVSTDLNYLGKLYHYYGEGECDYSGKFELYSIDGDKLYDLHINDDTYGSINDCGYSPENAMLNNGNVLLLISSYENYSFEIYDVNANILFAYIGEGYYIYEISPSKEYIVFIMKKANDGILSYDYTIINLNGVSNTLLTYENRCTPSISEDSHFIALVCSGDAVYLFDKYGNAILTTPVVDTSDGKSDFPGTYYSTENKYLIMVYHYYPFDSTPVPNKHYLKVIRIATNETVYEGLENNRDKELMYKEEEL
jgi:hypothetical protein